MAFDREALLKKLATALAAKPDHGFRWDNAPAVETSCAHCSGGHHGHGYGGNGNRFHGDGAGGDAGARVLPGQRPGCRDELRALRRRTPRAWSRRLRLRRLRTPRRILLGQREQRRLTKSNEKSGFERSRSFRLHGNSPIEFEI